MKTPLQELIKQLKESEQFITDEDSTLDRYYREGLREAIGKAESMLEKEKEVIIDAYRNGFYDNHSLRREINSETEKYYNEAFNTKAK